MGLSKNKFPCCVRAERKFPGIPERYFLLPDCYLSSQSKLTHLHKGKVGVDRATQERIEQGREQKKTNVLTYRNYTFLFTHPPSRLHILILPLGVPPHIQPHPSFIKHLINTSFINLFAFILSQGYS